MALADDLLAEADSSPEGLLAAAGAPPAPTVNADSLLEEADQDEGPGLGRRAVGLGLRIAGPLLGAPGGLPGIAAGALAGSALAQKVEGRDLDPVELAIDTGVSLIPAGRVGAALAGKVGGKAAVTGARAIGGRVLGGAIEGVGITAAETALKEQRLPTAGEAATAAVVGGAFGELVRRVDKRTLGRLEAEGLVSEQPAPVAGRSPSTSDVADDAASLLREADGAPRAVVAPDVEAAVPAGSTGGRYSDERLDRLASRLAPDDVPAQDEIRGVFQRSQDDIERATLRLTDDQAQALADRIDVPIALRSPGEAVSQPEVKALQDALVGVDQKVERLALELQASPGDEALARELSQAQDDLGVLLTNRIAVGSELGSTFRELGRTPRGRAAILTRGLTRLQKGLAPDQRLKPAEVSEFVKRLDAAGSDVERLKVAQELRDSVAKSGRVDAARNLFFSAILSRPTTQARNLIGNAANLLLVPARAVGASGRAAREARLAGVQRTSSLGAELAGIRSGGLSGLQAGLRRAREVLTTGVTTESAQAPEALAEVLSGTTGASELSKFKGSDIGPVSIRNVISRSLEAGDQLFRAINEEIAAHQGAWARARRELGKKASPQEVADRVVQLVGSTETVPGVRGKAVRVPGVGRESNLASEAAKAGARGTFQEKPDSIIQGLTVFKHSISKKSPVTGLVVDTVIPFLRTPGNLLRRGVTLSPFGQAFAEAAEQEIASQGLTGIAASRIRQQVAGEAIFGAAVTPLLVWLAEEGVLIGGAPQDTAERSRFFSQGKKPGSIQAGDVNVSTQVLGPSALPVSIVAETVRAFEDGSIGKDELSTRLASVVASNLDTIKDQSFLKGIADLVDALGGGYGDDRARGERLQAFVGQRAASFVPGIVQDTLRAIDSGGEASEVLDRPKSVGEAIGVALPGLGLPQPPPRIDPTGEIARRSNVIPGVSDVSRARPEAGELADVFDELDRLNRARKKAPTLDVIEPKKEQRVGGDVPRRGAPLSFPGKREIRLNDADDLALRRALTKARIDRVTDVIRSPGYERLNDTVRRKRLAGAVRNANEMVRARARRAITQGRPLDLEELLR